MRGKTYFRLHRRAHHARLGRLCPDTPDGQRLFNSSWAAMTPSPGLRQSGVSKGPRPWAAWLAQAALSSDLGVTCVTCASSASGAGAFFRRKPIRSMAANTTGTTSSVRKVEG